MSEIYNELLEKLSNVILNYTEMEIMAKLDKQFHILTKTGKNNTIYGSKKDGYIMINDRLYLTPQDILEKEFKIDARGYRMQEVDKFLDMVIRDYTEFLHTIKKLEQDNINLIEDNKKLQAEIRNLKESITANEDERPQGTSNVDLLRRISSLEKIVYGKDE